MNRINLLCPYCKSKEVLKAGKRIDKYQQIQRLMCKSCNKSFTDSSSKHKTYPIATILNSISLYNLGHSQAEIIKIISKKHKIMPSQNQDDKNNKFLNTVCLIN